MNRDHLTPRKRAAMEILDMVQEGIAVPLKQVQWALVVTGDLPRNRWKWS